MFHILLLCICFNATAPDLQLYRAIAFVCLAQSKTEKKTTKAYTQYTKRTYKTNEHSHVYLYAMVMGFIKDTKWIWNNWAIPKPYGGKLAHVDGNNNNRVREREREKRILRKENYICTWYRREQKKKSASLKKDGNAATAIDASGTKAQANRKWNSNSNFTLNSRINIFIMYTARVYF